MSQVSTLAAIIQNEAARGNAADQFGVASTIYNRTIGASGYTGPGYGGSAYAAATAPGQFSAYPNRLFSAPSAYATALATALVNGNLTSYGNPGNATYYNAPGSNAAYASGTGNAYGAGSNQYSDAYNQPPSANFELPQAGGASGDAGSAVADNASGGTPATHDSGSGSGAASGTTGSGGTSGAMGGAVQLSTQPQLTSLLSNLFGTLESKTGTLAKSLFAATIGDVEDWVVRGFLIAVGAVIIAVGLVYLMRPQLERVGAALEKAAVL